MIKTTNDGKGKSQSWEARLEADQSDGYEDPVLGQCPGVYTLNLVAWGATEEEAIKGLHTTVNIVRIRLLIEDLANVEIWNKK